MVPRPRFVRATAVFASPARLPAASRSASQAVFVAFLRLSTGGETGSSSMVVTLPARGLSLVLVANSAGLVKSFPLDKGDVTTSPFARIFLALFTR